MKTQLVILWTLIGMISGCSPHAFSPSARMMPLQSVATLRPGQMAVGAQGGTAAEVPGAQLVGGSARLRRGFTDSVEGSVEGMLLWVRGKRDIPTHRGIYGLRAGAKVRALDWLALEGGLGGGGSSAGGFVQPDVGVVLAFENPYLVPFIDGGAGLSLPLGARRVRIDIDDDQLPVYGKPRSTLSLSAHSGLRVPIAGVASVTAAIGFTRLFDRDDSSAFVQLGAIVEFYLD